MISLKKVLFVSLAAALLAAVVGATPRQASAGFGSSPGTEHGLRHTAGITDGTSNTIVAPGGSLRSRKSGGGPQESILVPESLPAPPFVPVPYPVSSAR
jgi:hypothetical protein